MILYKVYVNNPEYPSHLFDTYDHDKATKFIDTYNEVNLPEYGHKAYILEVDLSEQTVEKSADEVLAKYTVYYQCIVVLKNGEITEVTSRRVFNEDGDFEYATIYPDYTVVYLVFQGDPSLLDFNCPAIRNRMETLIQESDF